MCNAFLDPGTLRSGVLQCPWCRKTFEATVFQPREVQHAAVQVVTETPDGVAAACANHVRNAAVTNCQRCGLCAGRFGGVGAELDHDPGIARRQQRNVGAAQSAFTQAADDAFV